MVIRVSSSVSFLEAAPTKRPCRVQNHNRTSRVSPGDTNRISITSTLPGAIMMPSLYSVKSGL